MFGAQISERKDIFDEEFKKPGEWVVANIETTIAWPTRLQTLKYQGHKYWVIPVTTDAYPGIAARTDGIGRSELQRQILRLLSVISWVESGGAILNSFSGGGLPHSLGRKLESSYTRSGGLDLSYLPDVTDQDARLALALMREARGLNHSAYSFLSFFRAIEIAVGDGNKRKKWMPTAIESLTDKRAIEAIQEVRAAGVTDIALHLFESGRCAIAHATSRPIINPDDPNDTWRLRRELPIVEQLAERAIEERLGVKTTSTIYKEHYYELAGFKEFLGSDLVARVCANEPIPDGELIDLPNISLRLIGQRPYASFECLYPTHARQLKSGLGLSFTQVAGYLKVSFILNFEAERLEFEISEDISGPTDDDSPQYADMRADLAQFYKHYFMNGRLEIVDSDNDRQLSRKDAFMPVNVIVQPKEFDKDIEFWRNIAKVRRESIARF